MQQAVVKLTSRMSSSTKARLTLFLRLTIFTLAIGAGVAFTVALELFSWTYWYRPVCEDMSDKGCFNEPQVPGTPMVYYKVRRTSQVGTPYEAVCDEERTGDKCLPKVRDASGYIMYGGTVAKPSSPAHTLVSTAAVLSQIQPFAILRAATIGAYDPSRPQLLVTFTYDMQDTLTRQLEANSTGDVPAILQCALAKSIGQKAGVPPESNVVLYYEVATDCFHLYLAGGVAQTGFGLRPTPTSLAAARLRAPSKRALLEGQRLLLVSGSAHPRDVEIQDRRLSTILALCAHCDQLERDRALDDGHGEHKDRNLRVIDHELPQAFKTIPMIAAAEGEDVATIVRRSSSFFILIEVALPGDLADCFVLPGLGIIGVTQQSLYVLAIAAPMWLNIFFFGSDAYGGHRGYQPWSWPWSIVTFICLVHFAVQYVYGILYYFRALPFGFMNGLITRAYSFINRTLIVLSVSVPVFNILWLISAVYYNPNYVISLLTLFGSGIIMIFTTVATVNKFLRLAEQRAHEMAASLQHALKTLDVTRRQLRTLTISGILLFVGVAVFVFASSALWSASPNSIGYESTLLPLVVVAKKLQSDGVLQSAMQKIKQHAPKPLVTAEGEIKQLGSKEKQPLVTAEGEPSTSLDEGEPSTSLDEGEPSTSLDA